MQGIDRMNAVIEYFYNEIEFSLWRQQLAEAKKIDNDLYNEALAEGRCNCGYTHFTNESCNTESL